MTKKLTLAQKIIFSSLGVFIIILFSFLYAIKNENEKKKAEKMFNPTIQQDKSLDFGNILKDVDSSQIDLYQIKKLNPKIIATKKNTGNSLIDSLKKVIKKQAIRITQLEKSLKKAQQRITPKNKPARKTSRQPEEIDYEAYSNNMSNESSNVSEKQTVSKKEWVKLEIYEERIVKNQSIIGFHLPDPVTLGKVFIPEKAIVEGVCSIKGKRLHIDFQTIRTKTDEIKIEGKAYSLNRTPGLNTLVKRDKDMVKVLGDKTKKAVELFDPTGLINKISDTKKNDIPSPFYSEIPEGLEIFAYISLKREKR